VGRARGIALAILQWFESTSERLFFGMPLREQGAPRGERENEVGFGDVGICTYLYLFSD